MGDLKDLREQQEERDLRDRVRGLSDTLYLAGLGAYTKATTGSEQLYGKCLSAGAEAYGDDADGKSRLVLAGRGLAVSARKLVDEAPRLRRELYEEFIRTGKAVRGEDTESSNEFVLAGAGAVTTVRQRGRELFETLVSTGKQQRA